MGLNSEIEKKAKEIHSEHYAMSLGEISSLYKDGELDIHPDFQRIFRWDLEQKSRLIESILLGIPIPSIFVAQRDTGVWDVIDGLQRLSTIFEFMGILKGADGNTLPPLKLAGTKYLPSLSGIYWDNGDDCSLEQLQRLQIKRAKLQLQIVKKESDTDTKFELFQRLNTGGSRLSDQEVRNCILVMMDLEKFMWLKKLACNEDFLECTSLSERSVKEAYDMELVLRFLIYRNVASSEISRAKDLNELFTEKMIDFIDQKILGSEEEENVFTKTFSLLNKTLSDSAFRKYDSEQERFKGPFSISAFEAIIPGLSKHIDKHQTNEQNVEMIIQSLWTEEKFIENSGAGFRAADRVKHLFPLSEQLFNNEN